MSLSAYCVDFRYAHLSLVNMTKPELLIEVYTDPMCPWCWCGEAQLQKTLSSGDFEEKIGKYMRPVVKLRPYVLDSRLPATSFDPPSDKYDPIESTEYTKGSPPTKKDYYSKKFTNLDAFDQKITAAAQSLELEGFQWLTEGKVGATWLAHRLLWKALNLDEQSHESVLDKYTPGLQERLASKMYKAFHSESQDLSDENVLATLAVDEGIFSSRDEALAWLQTSEGEDEVRHATMMAEMNGVQSVPFTIVQDGSDHSSEVLTHDSLMKMLEMQAALHK